LAQTQSLEKGTNLRFVAQHLESALAHHALRANRANNPPRSKTKMKATLTWTTTLQVQTLITLVLMKMTKLTPLSLPPHSKKLVVSENTEAAGFGSDTSPRTESGDYEELSQAEAN
jgi:hypothetical protein